MRFSAVTINDGLLMVILNLCWRLSGTNAHKGIMFAIDGGRYQFDFVHNVTMHLHRLNSFKSFVVFRDHRTERQPPFILTRSLEQALEDDMGQPIFIFGPESRAKLRGAIGLNTMAFVEINSIRDPMLDVVDYTLKGLHFMPMLFIYKRIDNVPPRLAEIRLFFSWCWSINIINAVLTFQIITTVLNNNTKKYQHRIIKNQIYKYTPFPHLRVLNLTETIYNNPVFIEYGLINVDGYQFTAPIYMDPPSVFLTPYETHPHHKGEESFSITGTAGRIFDEYIASINGSIKLIPYHNVTFYNYHRETLLAAAHNKIDIGMHPFSDLLEFANQTEGSYPIGQTNACIIVPVRTEIYPGRYIMRAFESSIWYWTLLIYIGLMILQMLVSHSQGERNFFFGESILYAYNILLCQSLTWFNLNRRNFRNKVFHIFLLVFGYLMNCMYGTSLTSLMYTTIWGDQIETVDDFLASGLKVMLHEYERNIYFNTSRLPIELRNSLLVVELETLRSHRDALNTSFAYAVTSEMWLKLNTEQTLLWKPRFRIASNKLCTGNYFLKYPLQWDSPFIVSLALFTMTIMERGLHLKWQTKSIYQAMQLDLMKVIDEHLEHPKPLSISYISFALKIYLLMCLMATVCFFGELVHYRWMRKRRNRESNQ